MSECYECDGKGWIGLYDTFDYFYEDNFSIGVVGYTDSTEYHCDLGIIIICQYCDGFGK